MPVREGAASTSRDGSGGGTARGRAGRRSTGGTCGQRAGAFIVALVIAVAAAAGALGPVPAAAQSYYPECGSVRPMSGPGDLPMSSPSIWSCAGDLQPLEVAGPANGGPAGDTSFSSSHEAVPEECPPVGTACGRGEFGYGGGELASGSVLLDNADTTTTGDHFACPVSAGAVGASAVVSATLTTTGAGGVTPALLLHAGTFSGGSNGTAATTTGDVQCYDPYLTSPSAAMGGATGNGAAYAAACILYASCLGAGAFATLLYIPESSAAGSACRGRVLAAGGWDGSQDVSSAALYDPRAAINGSATPNNPAFNTWGSLAPSSGYRAAMMLPRDSALVVQLSPTRWLIAGGRTESNPYAGSVPTNTYEIFDATGCGFLPVVATMTAPRYDAGAAKFANGTVLICGGTLDFSTHTPLSTCDVFTPKGGDTTNGGSWTLPAPLLSTARSRLFAQFLPGTVTASNPNGDILMAGGDTASNGVSDSEECTESPSGVFSCGQNVAGWDNYCSDNTHAGCHTGSSQNDLGYTFDPNGGGIYDSSHVLVGYLPAETAACPVGGDPMCPIRLPGGTPSSTWDGLVLECGGYNPASNSTGNDTLIGCEYYVPAGVTIPSDFLISGTTYRCGNNTPANGKGPAWCTEPGLHLNRERAYFNLAEIPYSNGVNDSFVACGGMYGQDDVSFQLYLVRKNCETLGKGNVAPGGGPPRPGYTFAECPPACTTPVAGGENHSLAVLGDGTVWSWGSDNRGQLGDGTNTDSGTGVRASNTTGMSGVVSVAAGAAHSLALDGSGNAWAWGADDSGQLGDGGTTDRNTPEKIMSGVYEVAAGSAHSLALANNGTVWSWGANYSGQFGNGGTTGGLAPVQVPGLPSIVAIAAGWDHSLALDTVGNVWAWGGNYFGAVGDGTTTNRLTPAVVLSGAASIAAGYFHSIAAMQDGSVRTWGWNQFGQLGTGGTASSASPVAVCAAGAVPPCSSRLTGISSVAGGYGHTLALRSSDGTVWAWGDNDHYQLGNNSTTSSSTPIQVWNSTSGSFLTGVTAVSAGEYQSTALTAAGSEWEWGQHPDPGFCAVATQYPQTPTKTSTGAIAVAIAVAETTTVIVLTVFSPYTTTQAWDPRCQLAVPSERRVDIDKGAQTSASVYASYTDVSGKAAPLRWGYDFPTVNNGFGYYHIDGKHGFDAAVQSQLGTTLASPTATATDPNSTQSNPRTDFYLYYTDTTSNAQCTRKAIVDYGPSNSVPANPMGVVTSYAYVGWHNG